MGCAQSAPEEKYQFTYKTAEDNSSSQAASNVARSIVSKKEGRGKGGGSKVAAEAEKSTKHSGRSMTSSKTKAKFGKAVRMTAAGNAFAQAGSKRATRRARKRTSLYGWLAKDMTIGPGCGIDKFEVKRVIGTGLMGTVLLAMFKKDETWCALKCVKKDYVCRHDDGRHIQAERHLLEVVDNPFVVTMFGTFQDKIWVYFVLEYAAGGELFSRLHNKKGKFGNNTSKFYLSEILLALEHIQSLGYAYRDLKPENIMLDEEGHCKLVDFGFSAKPDRDGLLHTNVGTPAYLSPEQLNHKKTGGYKKIVDFWSFGIITYELMTGKTPFCKSHKESSYAIYLRVLKGKISFPKYFEASCKEMVRSLLVADVDKRLTSVEGIKKCAWFGEVEWGRVLAREVVPPHVPKLKENGDCHYFDNYGEMNDSQRNPEKIDNSIFHGF